MNYDDVKNLYDFYQTRCDRYKDSILFDNRITYGEAWELASARAAFLQKEGFKKGDAIGLLAASNAEWCITYMAVTMMGAVVVPLDVNLPAEQYPPMLKEVKCKTVFISDEYKKTLKRIKTFSVGLDSCMAKRRKFKIPEITEDETACFVFTSGTTGASKIVELTHANIFKMAIGTSDFLELSTADMNLCILPLFHVYALDANFVGPFANGGALLFQPSLKGPDIMESLANNPITIFPAAPLLWELFMDAIINKVKAESALKYRLFMFFLKRAPVLKALGLGFLVKKIFTPIHDLFGHSHRFFISGGAPLKRQYAIYYRNMGFTLIEGYGLTETTGPISLPDYRKNVIGSVGRPTPGNYVILKNINNEGIGEIWLAGDAVMPGYYKNDEANAVAFDDDGFFNTGDLGRLDKKGNIFITGRSKNVIVLSSGKNVYPEELEAYYKESNAVAEIAVFGHESGGTERVFAVIVPSLRDEGSYARVKKELEKLSRGLPDYRTIHDFAISLEPLPVNSTRKILYREVEANLKKGVYQVNEEDSAVLTSTLSPRSPSEELIINLLKKKLKKNTLYASQILRDFDIDSLGLVDLAVYFEQNMQVIIDVAEFKKNETLEAIVEYLLALEKTEGTSIDDQIFGGEIKHKPNRIFNPLHHLVLAFLKFISILFWKVEISNRSNFEEDNIIVVANHQSYLDMVWLAWAFPPAVRSQIYVTGKSRLKFLRYVFPVLPVIWIDDDNTLDVLKASADMLRQGKSILIFPEGTRTPDGYMHDFKSGAAYLAYNLGKKILPVTIKGAFQIWSRHEKLPKLFSGLRGFVAVGELIDPKKYKNVDKLIDAMEKKVAENLQVNAG